MGFDWSTRSKLPPISCQIPKGWLSEPILLSLEPEPEEDMKRSIDLRVIREIFFCDASTGLALGWPYNIHPEEYYIIPKDPPKEAYKKLPYYSRRASAAWKLVRRMNDLHFDVMISTRGALGKEGGVKVWEYWTGNLVASEAGCTPASICRTCLRAIVNSRVAQPEVWKLRDQDNAH